MSPDDLAACTETLVALNRIAAETAAEFEVHAATDVTGFGLAGHALEMALGSGMRLDLSFADTPVFSGAEAMYQRGMTTGSNTSNREMVLSSVEFTRPLSAAEEELLFDPQTNGGLLFALPESAAADLVNRLHDAGVAAARRIGTAVAYDQGPHLKIY